MPAINVATCVPLPMRIALDWPVTPGLPITMLLLSLAILKPAFDPNAMLLLPLVLFRSALNPIAVLSLPVVLPSGAADGRNGGSVWHA